MNRLIKNCYLHASKSICLVFTSIAFRFLRFIKTMSGMKKPMLVSFVLVGITPVTTAQPMTPKSGDFVVAKWQVNAEEQKQTASLEYIEWLVNQGQYAGKSAYNYGRANALLLPHLSTDDADPKAWYLAARILQHQHQFKAALQALDKVQTFAGTLTNATLLKANIQLVLSDFTAARHTCLSLLGQTELLMVAACSLEIESYQGKLEDSYQQLTALLTRYELPNDESGVWLIQLLADMAYRQNDPQTALNWLNQYTGNNKPLSFIVQWADMKLALRQSDSVMQELIKVVTQAEFKDDALLLRLALGEKQIGGGNYWAGQMAERVTLREQRQDKFHAAELARYYLEIQPDPTKALHWAEINWQSAKLEADKILLQQAKRSQTSVGMQYPIAFDAADEQ